MRLAIVSQSFHKLAPEFFFRDLTVTLHAPTNYAGASASLSPYTLKLVNDSFVRFSYYFNAIPGITPDASVYQTYLQVRDTNPPTITCPAAQTVFAPTTNSSFVISWRLPNATDDKTLQPKITNSSTFPVADVTVKGSLASISRILGTTLPLNTNLSITYTATDTYGNTASCSFSLIAKDRTAPTIICPANRIDQISPDDDLITISWNPVAVRDNANPDASLVVTVAVVPPSGAAPITVANSQARFPEGDSAVT
eukprot:m.738693 g.738693  ORF g.738693 m.738693 type:complete len:254 (-) comp58910_c0_seq2:559-1320(-)